MAIGIDDLDDDDVLVQEEEVTTEPQEVTFIPEPQSNGDDFVSDFLKTRGIDDIQKINFEDEDGQLIERSWNDLSKEEKINILNTPLEEPQQIVEDNNNLTEEEINFINTVRQSNMSIGDYLNQLSSNVETVSQYKIDDLSDDELYLLDLESRVGELSDDEAAQALNIAKQQSEELYKKQVDGIRKEYKEREDFNSQQEQARIEQEQQEAFENYQAQVVDSINNLTSIGNFDLNFEDSDKEMLAEFMLSQDESGKNYLYQALQDPETLTKAAWFILNGEDAFNSIQEYFVNQIKQISKVQYEKGLNDGKNGSSTTTKPTLYVDKNKNNKPHRIINDADNLFDDD